MKNPPRGDLMVKKGYGYDGGRQHRGSSGTGHCSCDPCYSFLVGMPTAGLKQSRTEIYTGRGNIYGKISTSGFFQYVFTSFLILM